MNAMQSLIRLPEVRRLTGLSRTTIYRLERESRFVARVRIGDRAIAWRLAEVVSWVESRPLADAGPVYVGRGSGGSPVADRARGEVMSTPKGYRPASPERIPERIAWANAVALADDEDCAARAVLLFAAEYADADDQLVIDDGGEPEINRRARGLAHVIEYGRLAHSQLVALMQPAADKDVRIACRKLVADGDINITEVGGLTVYVDVRVES
jgi:prophage regulatory protein